MPLYISVDGRDDMFPSTSLVCSKYKMMKKMFAVPYSPWRLRKGAKHGSIGLFMFTVSDLWLLVCLLLCLLVMLIGSECANLARKILARLDRL